MKKRSGKRKTHRGQLTQMQQHAAAVDWVYLAWNAFDHGEFDRAEEHVRRALRIEPGHQGATLLLSTLFLGSPRQREAHGLILEALRKHPNDPKLHFVLARSAAMLGNVEEARHAILRLQRLVREGPVALNSERRRALMAASRLLLRDFRRGSRTLATPGPASSATVQRGQRPYCSAPCSTPQTPQTPQSTSTPPRVSPPARRLALVRRVVS